MEHKNLKIFPLNYFENVSEHSERVRGQKSVSSVREEAHLQTVKRMKFQSGDFHPTAELRLCLLCRTWNGPIRSWRKRIWMRLFLCLRMMKRRICRSTSSPSLQPPTFRAPPQTLTSDGLSNSLCCFTTTKETSW